MIIDVVVFECCKQKVADILWRDVNVDVHPKVHLLEFEAIGQTISRQNRNDVNSIYR